VATSAVALIMAAEGESILRARVGMLPARNHGRERVSRTDRKEIWGKRKLTQHQ
jgi:hypothetical protein